MKKSFLNQLAVRRWQTGSARAFTLTELLVVMGVMAMLAAVLLSASFTTQEGVLRAQCVSNLRQIGVGLNLYSTEANGYLPQMHLPDGANPWETDLACRNTPGTHTITMGPYNLGLLWSTKILPDPKVFYCPSLGKSSVWESYEYYCYPNGTGAWPTDPLLQPNGVTEDKVRTGYFYYPQSKTLERIPPYSLPVLAYSCPLYQNKVTYVSPFPGDPIQRDQTDPCPLKITDTDPSKAMVVDQLMQLSGLAHQNNGQPAGANALFLDGHVKFQTVNGNSGPNQAFNVGIWSAGDGVLGNDGTPSPRFKRVMSYFQP
jgi:prepilin-type N-terminal cleavage/methylation domain-containing protein/prepilin-type processing-associated H-X9-DG protein